MGTFGNIFTTVWTRTYMARPIALNGRAVTAMLANQAGTTVGHMVLLSCPVHWPKYSPDFNKVGKVVSIRVHLDLVILADRGGQHFPDSRIHENVLPIWFDHFATHEPGVWQRYNVPSML